MKRFETLSFVTSVCNVSLISIHNLWLQTAQAAFGLPRCWILAVADGSCEVLET